MQTVHIPGRPFGKLSVPGKLFFTHTFYPKTIDYSGLNRPFDYQNKPCNSLAFLEAYAFRRLLF
jgi:hypothetical protein